MVDGSALTPMTLPSPAFTRSPRWPCWRRVGALAPRGCSHTWVPPRSPERHLPPCRRAGLLAGWALPYPAPILDMLMAISMIYLPCWPLSALSPHCHGQHRRPPLPSLPRGQLRAFLSTSLSSWLPQHPARWVLCSPPTPLVCGLLTRLHSPRALAALLILLGFRPMATTAVCLHGQTRVKPLEVPNPE